MGKVFWAALCAAGVLGLAGHAAATVVIVHEAGVYTAVTGPAVLFPRGYCTQCSGQLTVVSSFNLGSFGADFTFDTSLGVRTTSPFQDVITWDTSMGTPSPILSGSWFAGGVSGQISQNLTTATSVTLERNGNSFLYTIIGSDFQIRSLPYTDFVNVFHSLDETFNMVPNNTVTNDTYNSGGYYSPTWSIYSQYLKVSVLTPQPVPEPSTWAMLILGFFGLGSALRHNRQRRYAGAL